MPPVTAVTVHLDPCILREEGSCYWFFIGSRDKMFIYM